MPTGKNADGTPAIYYTDDKQDAIATAWLLNGYAVKLVIRSGTYTKE